MRKLTKIPKICDSVEVNNLPRHKLDNRFYVQILFFLGVFFPVLECLCNNFTVGFAKSINHVNIEGEEVPELSTWGCWPIEHNCPRGL